jgi:glycosyltransferase involved in cell wall biosynthesis
MRRLRLLWVVPNLPRRGVAAARERWWALLKRLATRHDITLLALVDPEDAGAEAELPPELAQVHLVPKTPWRLGDPLALLPSTVAGAFSNPAFRTAIQARLAASRYDVAQFEYIEMANLIPPATPRSILTVHQVGFAQWRPRWRAQRGGARRSVLMLQRYLRDLDFELRAVRRVHHVITMSPEDAARLRRFHPQLRISVSPCGVDCNSFRPPAAPRAPEVDLLFVGHFDHPPNPDAAGFLVGQVVPRLSRPVRVRIVGRGVTREIAALARRGAVEVTGPVPDVRPHLAAAAVFTAPVRFGTGMRGKVLEALAMSRPVVTTSVGAEGLGATSGRHLLIADGAADFAAAVRRVLDDPELGARLGTAGRALVEARFDWDTIAAAHDTIYDEVLRDDGRMAPWSPAPVSPSRFAPLARLGYYPARGTGFMFLATRGLRWHLRRFAPGGRAPALPHVIPVSGRTPV